MVFDLIIVQAEDNPDTSSLRQGQLIADQAVQETTRDREDLVAIRFGEMRWPISKKVGPSRRNREHPQLEQLILVGTSDSYEQARTRLLELVSSESVSPQEAIPIQGRENRKITAQLYRQMDLAYEYALLYGLTGELEWADKAKWILLRFAEVIPHWPFYDREGTRRDQKEKDYYNKWDANGFWSWHPLDLAVHTPLLRAYDLVRPTLSYAEEKNIREGLFVYHKETIDRFTALLPIYHNLAGNHLVALVAYGQVLERPDYIHEVVSYMQRFFRYAYAADGFFKELTPGYHQQMSARMVETLPNMLAGYSDPVGYVNRQTGKRFDNLDPEKEFGIYLQQIRPALGKLAMPNHNYVTINDSWPPGSGRQTRFRERDNAVVDHPSLLGVSGLAKLGSKGMVAFLQFGGIRGHDHHDALNLIWYAAGLEVLSDTGYQPLPNSDSKREWHTIAASHNTVAVNEQTHFVDRDAYKVAGDRSGGWSVFPSSYPDRHQLEASLPAAAAYANQGKLLVWNVSSSSAQAMEAEHERAYAPGLLSLFRRTTVMVPVEGDEGYLVDIFRIKGGHTHDYFLRGGLDQSYTLQFNQPMQIAKGKSYQYINLEKRAQVQLPLKATIRFSDSPVTLLSRLVVVYGTKDSTLEVVQGNAPAIRRLGHAPFSFVRRQANHGVESLTSDYVWIHEATRGESRIKAVGSIQENDNIVVKIQLQDRTDVIFSAPEDDARFFYEGIHFNGRLGYVSVAQSPDTQTFPTGVIFSGRNLEKDGRILASCPERIVVPVVRVTEKQADGENISSDAVYVRLEWEMVPDDLADCRIAHIDLGDVIRYSIPVERVEVEDGMLKVVLSHSPGFKLEGNSIVMTRFPGWRIQGQPVLRLE